MINLLPVEEKKMVLNEYRFRMIIFSLYMVGMCFAVGAIALLPSYFLVSVKESIATKKLAMIESLPVSQPDQETMGAIKDINAKISVINQAEQGQFLVLENAFDQVILQKMPDIKLTAISYDVEKDGTKQVSVQGFAQDRERLLLFRQALQNDPLFSAVDLPISNFVKEKDITFSLNLTTS